MPYLAIIGQDDRAFGGFVPELHVSAAGDSFEEVELALQQGIALYLHEVQQVGAAAPTPRLQSLADVPAGDLDGFSRPKGVLLEGAPINPLSVLIDRAVEEAKAQGGGLSDSEIARRVGTSPAGLLRLRDFFYWGHSLAALRKLEGALGIRFTFDYRRAG